MLHPQTPLKRKGKGGEGRGKGCVVAVGVWMPLSMKSGLLIEM